MTCPKDTTTEQLGNRNFLLSYRLYRLCWLNNVLQPNGKAFKRLIISERLNSPMHLPHPTITYHTYEKLHKGGGMLHDRIQQYYETKRCTTRLFSCLMTMLRNCVAPPLKFFVLRLFSQCDYIKCSWEHMPMPMQLQLRHGFTIVTSPGSRLLCQFYNVQYLYF